MKLRYTPRVDTQAMIMPECKGCGYLGHPHECHQAYQLIACKPRIRPPAVPGAKYVVFHHYPEGVALVLSEWCHGREVKGIKGEPDFVWDYIAEAKADGDRVRLVSDPQKMSRKFRTLD